MSSKHIQEQKYKVVDAPLCYRVERNDGHILIRLQDKEEANLICEAFNVKEETGCGPRELLEKFWGQVEKAAKFETDYNLQLEENKLLQQWKTESMKVIGELTDKCGILQDRVNELEEVLTCHEANMILKHEYSILPKNSNGYRWYEQITAALTKPTVNKTNP